MDVVNWLLQGDNSFQLLTRKYILDEHVKQTQTGLIKRYYDKFDFSRNRFGEGLYGPKWISTHYTMLELTDLEANPSDEVFAKGLNTLLSEMWSQSISLEHYTIDLCIPGMLLKMAAYAKTNHPAVYQIVDYILHFQMDDGGWNCRLEGPNYPKISSVHTTINVLEGLNSYIQANHSYQRDACIKAFDRGVNALLDRELINIKNSDVPLFKSITTAHYPPRWKYDYLRVLVLLVDSQYPYDLRMQKALNLLKIKMKNGKLLRGPKIPGRTHFEFESERYGRMNTIRALRVLKAYDNNFYNACIIMDV